MTRPGTATTTSGVSTSSPLSGRDVHGEADLVHSYSPVTVLDEAVAPAGSASSFARRGVAVIGADMDGSMITTARRLAPDLDG